MRHLPIAIMHSAVPLSLLPLRMVGAVCVALYVVYRAVLCQTNESTLNNVIREIMP
jgi:hypothetical protein